MNRSQLFENIKKKESFLCIGLDTDPKKIPQHLLGEEDPVFEFNRQIIDATARFAVAYKPNFAFYEGSGIAGLISLGKTTHYIREKYPDLFLIADAKRGDIGNTSSLYARAFFSEWNYDAVTVAPYMGVDSVKPFLDYQGKWVILLALTSNRGADDFQYHGESGKSGERLFEKVLRLSQEWGSADNMMYVVGATRAEMLSEIREIVPDHFLLIPGVGAQGGSLADVVKYGMNRSCGLLVNSSRAIILADNTSLFDSVAAEKAGEIQAEMRSYLKEYSLI